jgi:hypothetical protein
VVVVQHEVERVGSSFRGMGRALDRTGVGGVNNFCRSTTISARQI